ncbi:hypothetical protein [Romboutsia sp. Marseille-P6047]|uniref:hypothetical protein n=1 Tax=Romboutsia sp. Marseille-P6047 TaxID=2161817 RepID=UPI000F05744D|nr:hypothetical protein [Romboutsia sp. Marseille-P6047]
MKKVNQSKRILNEPTELTNLVNHGHTYNEIKNIIEDEDEEVVRKSHKKGNLKAPSYDEAHNHNKLK